MAGLYASILPLVAYALVGSSRQLVVGPDAAMAVLVAASIAPLAAGGGEARYAQLAGALALMIGLLCALGAFCRVGFMANFLAKPVVVGYMHGIALIILLGQLPKALGLSLGAEEPWNQVIEIGRRLGEANGVAVVIAAASLAAILACRRFAPRIPGQVVVLVAAPLAVAILGLERYGVAVLGSVPSGLPRPQAPLAALDDIRALLPTAFAGALVAFSDTMVTARAFAARNHYHVDADQEMLALGAANVVSALTQGLPLSASGSRTAVAESAGSRSQVTSLVAAATIVLALLFLTPLLSPLPHAALAAILLAAAWNLCSFAEFGRLRRFHRGGFALAVLTLLGVAGVGVLEGILLGVVLSLVLLVRHAAFPQDAVLGRMNGGTDFRDLARSPGCAAVPGVLVYRMAGPLFFANAQHFRTRVLQLVDSAAPRVQRVVIDAAPVTGMDLAGADSFIELIQDLTQRDMSFAIADAYAPLRDDLARAGVLDVLGPEGQFPTVDAAVAARG